MLHTLVSKLGGLINRRVLCFPFSRSLVLSSSRLLAIRNMIEQCKSEGGILLVQPEHLLSFKLVGVDKTWAMRGKLDPVGENAVRLHQEIEAFSRDIVDECDENFNVKYELIYTMGTQQPVDMSPDRWILIQGLFSIIIDTVQKLRSSRAVEVLGGMVIEEHGPARFPTLRII